MPAMELTLCDPTPEQVRGLEESLDKFNVAATGIRDGRSLGLFFYDDRGAVAGGLAGHTWGGTCEIRQLWVREALRGRGYGRRLVEAALAEATRRGCRQVVLTTHSFQAPGFYRKLGFTVVAEVAGYPDGHAQIVLRKRLSPQNARCSDDSA